MTIPDKYYFKLAENENDYGKARNLFMEYAGSLDFDLHFQDFDKELEEIAFQYNKPDGGLILITVADTGKEVGCVGIRKFEDQIAELKRMFVKASHRNSGLGQVLIRKAINLSIDLGYNKIRLDTLDTMKAAISLYEKFGFRETGSYRYNPHDNVRYYELIL